MYIFKNKYVIQPNLQATKFQRVKKPLILDIINEVYFNSDTTKYYSRNVFPIK